MKRLLNYFRNLGFNTILWVFLGNIFIGVGVAIFKLSGLGNDPFNAMDMAVAERFNFDYPTLQVCVNLSLLILEVIFGRKYIGLGTIVNSVLCGYVTKFCYWLFTLAVGDKFNIVISVLIMIVGVLVTSLGLSLYQQSNGGISPYDSLPIIISEKHPKYKYFWCRITFDATAVIICFIAGNFTGNHIGVGTLAAAFGLGPFVHMFDKHTVKLFKKKA